MRRAVPTLVFVSESLRQFFLSTGHLNRDRTAVIADGIDASAFAPRRDTSLRRGLGIGEAEALGGGGGNGRPRDCYDGSLPAGAALAPDPPHPVGVRGAAEGGPPPGPL